jgi:hypothetical protein
MTDSPENRLAEIRAQRAALRAEIEKPITVEDEIAAEERALARDKAVAAAVAKHGALNKKISVVDTDEGFVIVKRPHPLNFQKFQDEGKTDGDAFDDLVRPCLVSPASDFDRINAALPATLTLCANAVVELAGFRTKERAGK